ncbi:MAG: TIGR03032 family protein, partial [Solirubrobacterales bacterium]
ESGEMVSHPDLPDWRGQPWSGPLIPGWEELRGKDLSEIVARQWAVITEILLGDLEQLDAGRWAVTDHTALLVDPATHVDRVCEFLGIEPSEEITAPLRMVREELQTADRRIRQGPSPAIEHVRPKAIELEQKTRELFAEAPGEHAPVMQSADSPLRSVYSGGMRELVARLDGSVLVSTYQTGKLICLRGQDGTVNTHFRNFDKPMGLAVHQGRFALGGRTEVWDFRDLPEAAPKVEPAGTHDACYLPRNRHVTGDIAVHEIGFAQGELWLVATAFSCLGTLDANHSFVPRWKPDFISELVPGDRCHLNGLCVVDDEVRYVTALGQTDEPGGWRENKARGGVLLEVPSSEVIVEGLSMPHSPRWRDGRLWFLESGEGGLCVADLDELSWETVAELPGFTRGLAFAGDIALVGLTQIRETATFGGLPLTERLDQDERLCGVWAIDTASGESLGFLRFEELVQEVFDVAILPGVRFPEIAEPGSTAASQSFSLP